MIDFSKYNLWFEDYCKEHNKVFKSQKEADEFYGIWIEGFNWASYIYYQKGRKENETLGFYLLCRRRIR